MNLLIILLILGALGTVSAFACVIVGGNYDKTSERQFEAMKKMNCQDGVQPPFNKLSDQNAGGRSLRNRKLHND